ncbi:hypothetical protein [Paraclostridium bifermentans]|uniref:hypothetical protein n=1 Tax=Paraclostridium bifermentans TaxID=1490 RepID=UPI0024B88353|nr:hypothetical protein [Paraclostridium bifermentans]
MIKINYEENKENIENMYWDWFSKYHLKTFKKILINDNVLMNFIFKQAYSNEELIYNLMKDDNIKDDDSSKQKLGKENIKINNFIRTFLVMLPISHQEAIDYFNKNEINSESKNFFLKRYDNFRKSQAPKIINKLNIRVCPYCNKNYIDVYMDDKNNPIRFNGDLDHYFPKEKYPYLAINLYNLIPSCKVCNQEKGDREKKIFHPYLHSHIGTYKFKTSFTDNPSLDYLYGKTEEFNITMEPSTNCNVIVESNDLFHLKEKYSYHKKYVKELIQKVHIYNDNILEEFQNELFNIDEQNNKTIFTKDEIKKLIFSNDFNEDKHLDRSLSKLTYDILQEFGVE